LEIPDFKDWTELKIKRRVRCFLDGRPFFELRSYIKYESINKILSGVSAFFYEKEIIKIWTASISSDKGNKKIIALLLEDGKWAVSLPIYDDRDSFKVFDISRDLKNFYIKIKILTESGWKRRMLKAE